MHEFRCLGCYEKVHGEDFDSLNGSPCPKCGKPYLKYYGQVKPSVESGKKEKDAPRR